MYDDQYHDQPRRLIGNRIAPENQRRRQQDHSVPQNGCKKCDPKELAHIVLCRFRIACSHALSDHCDKGKPQSGSHQSRHRPETLCHTVGRDLHGPEKSRDTAERYFRELEQAVLNSVWHCDPEDPFYHAAFPVKNIFPFKTDTDRVGKSFLPLFTAFLSFMLLLSETEYQYDHCGKCPRDQRRICDSRHARMENKYADRISRYIDPVRCKGNIHGHVGLSHTPVYDGAGIIDSDRRIRVRGYPQIGHAGFHYILIHLSEQKP